MVKFWGLFGTLQLICGVGLLYGVAHPAPGSDPVMGQVLGNFGTFFVIMSALSFTLGVLFYGEQRSRRRVK